jgi:hypothetical protein
VQLRRPLSGFKALPLDPTVVSNVVKIVDSPERLWDHPVPFPSVFNWLEHLLHCRHGMCHSTFAVKHAMLSYGSKQSRVPIRH